MAMPPWRMGTAASATTEVTSRGDGWGVKNSRIIKRIHHILLSADFNVISAKIVREMLEADLNVDLSARRTFIIDTVSARTDTRTRTLPTGQIWGDTRFPPQSWDGEEREKGVSSRHAWDPYCT